MNASMFGKNDESTSASAHTKQKKDIYLYKSRNNNNQQITMTNSNSKISMVKSYDTFLSTVKGHTICNDASCNYTTYLDSSTDKIAVKNIDDWNVTRVDYTGIQLDASNNPIEDDASYVHKYRVHKHWFAHVPFCAGGPQPQQLQ